MHRFLSLPALLAGTALLGAVGVAYLGWTAWQTYREAQDLYRRSRQAARSVEAVETQTVRLWEELSRLQASPPPVPMPTQEEARGLADDLLALSERYRLEVVRLEVARGALAPPEEGGEALPVVRIQIQVIGGEEGLLALLRRVDETPTAVVERLDFSRPALGGEAWQMQMSVRVAYRQEG